METQFNEDTIETLYKDNLVKASQQLGSLIGREPPSKILSGWLYEQTIRHCLYNDLVLCGLSVVSIEEQVPISGRASVDLLVNSKVAIEVKSLGSFGNDVDKYTRYRYNVEQQGWVYLYLTRGESYYQYRLNMEATFGKESTFFLDISGDWQRFIDKVIEHLG